MLFVTNERTNGRIDSLFPSAINRISRGSVCLSVCRIDVVVLVVLVVVVVVVAAVGTSN